MTYLSIVSEQKLFQSHDDFKKWKEDFEKQEKCSYIFANSVLRKDKTKIIHYICHCSGNYLPNIKETNTRQRALQSKGSKKMGSTCPARMKLKVKNDSHLSVDFVSTHVGHALDVGRLRLTASEREGIAGKLLKGIKADHILQDIKKTFDINTRIAYTTNQDVYNIQRSFKVQSDVKFDQDDANSVNILVEKYKNIYDNPILYYKPYDIADSQVGNDNFVLIFMSTAQQEMLIKYGNDIIMINSTNGINPYNIQLTTLMVVDNDNEGFPVAFLWSITQTENIFQHFFSCIKSKVPDLKPKIFMSDDANAFFNAFVKEYGCQPEKLLCDWHVKKKLTDNLSKISDVEKRKLVKKDIQSLINELDVHTFEIQLLELITRLTSDSITIDYGKYFVKYYSNRPEQWAHCFRKNCHRNTNMCLEKWHQEIKPNTTTRGQYQKKLGLSIANVIERLRMKFMKKLVCLSRNKLPHKLNELQRRHEVAEQMADATHILEKTNNSKWLVPSSKNNDSLLEYYCVSVNDEATDCRCHFRCADCNSCLHTFSCTCHDYAIQYNMCKHIHLVCIKCLKNSKPLSNGDREPSHDGEYQTIHRSFNKPATSLEAAKSKAMKKLQILMNSIKNCESLEAITYVSQQLSTIQSELYTLTP